jgi:hypothetical protein
VTLETIRQRLDKRPIQEADLVGLVPNADVERLLAVVRLASSLLHYDSQGMGHYFGIRGQEAIHPCHLCDALHDLEYQAPPKPAKPDKPTYLVHDPSVDVELLLAVVEAAQQLVAGWEPGGSYPFGFPTIETALAALEDTT